MPSENYHGENVQKEFSMQYKTFPFKILETKNKEDADNDCSYGIVKGYASTYGNIDRCNDVILEGAFNDSIHRYRSENRQIKVYYQHNTMDRPIGGILPENIDSDLTGLPVKININKQVQLGREVYALAVQGVLSDMSIGYMVDEYDYDKDGVRLLKKLSLYEVSIVGEPANEKAKISEVKAKIKSKFFKVDDVKNIITKKDYEDALRESGAFSKEAAVFLAAHFIEKSRSDSADYGDSNILDNLNELSELLTKI